MRETILRVFNEALQQTDKEKIQASINLKRVSSRIKAMAFL